MLLTAMTHLNRRTTAPRGAVLVIVAVISLGVALTSAALLAFAMAQFRSSDDAGVETQARTATEGTLDLAAWQIKENLRRIPGVISPGGAFAGRTVKELTRPEIQQVLTDPSQAWVGTLGFPTTRDTAEIFVGQERLGELPTMDESALVSNILGPTDQRKLEFLSDTQFVQRLLDYNYHPGGGEEEVTLYAHGQIRRGSGDIRTSTMRRTYNQTVDFYGSKERSRDDLSVITAIPPSIESPHDLTAAAVQMPYPNNMNRSWDVSYDEDPANRGRKVKRIGLVFEAGSIGLEDPGDQLSFSNWVNGRFDVPFNSMVGPISTAGQMVIENPGVDSTTMRIKMLSDAAGGLAPYNPNQFGFKLAGIKYYFDQEDKGAFYETPHPYTSFKSSVSTLGTNVFAQTVWSPFNLTEDEAGNVVIPGGDTGGGVIDPTIIQGQGGVDRSSIVQAMRLEFSSQFELDPGDVLQVINANNGQPLATYAGVSGALALTPFATRVRANVPLGIQLRLTINGAASTNPYGYLVSAVEYVGETGQVIRQELPMQRTAHNANLGATDNAPFTWGTTIFQPTPPGGAALTNWSIHFNRATNLFAASPTDTDQIRMTLIATAAIPVPTSYVPTGGAFDPPPLGFQIITTGMTNKKFTFGPNVKAVIIEPLIDDEGSYVDEPEHYGFWVDTVSFTANNANDIDFSQRSLATIQAFSRTATYPDYGSSVNEMGEWWVSVPGQTEIGLHFLRSDFRMGPGDALDVYDGTGNLVVTLDGDLADAGGGIILDPDQNGGGVVGELLAPTNLPGTIEAQFGWVLVKGDTARLVLRGDGGENNGYNGFIIDRLAYFENSYLTNSERETLPADPTHFNERSTGPATGFGEVR